MSAPAVRSDGAAFRIVGHRARDCAIRAHLGEVANASQQTVDDPRRTAGTARDLHAWLSFALGHTSFVLRQAAGRGPGWLGSSVSASGVSLGRWMMSTTWCLIARPLEEVRVQHAGLFAGSADLRSFLAQESSQVAAFVSAGFDAVLGD